MQLATTATTGIQVPIKGWANGSTPKPSTRTWEPLAVGELLIRHTQSGDYDLRDQDAVMPVYRGSAQEGTAFDTFGDAMNSAIATTIGPDHGAVGIERSYANNPTRRVFRLVPLVADGRGGAIEPLHLEQGSARAGLVVGKVIDARFPFSSLESGMFAVVDGAFNIVAGGK